MEKQIKCTKNQINLWKFEKRRGKHSKDMEKGTHTIHTKNEKSKKIIGKFDFKGAGRFEIYKTRYLIGEEIMRRRRERVEPLIEWHCLN